jgi:ketosteroid isomerase-like protein
MAEMVPRVCRVLDAIEARDWEFLRTLLAPDVHWTTAIEDELYSADAVIAAFRHDPPPAPPSWHEADPQGRIIRWIDCPG